MKHRTSGFRMYGETNLISLAHGGGGGGDLRHRDGLPEQLNQAIAASSSDSAPRHLSALPLHHSHELPGNSVSLPAFLEIFLQQYILFYRIVAARKGEASSRGRSERSLCGNEILSVSGSMDRPAELGPDGNGDG